ncbi:MAG: sulfite exporter TauE/SafE family protein [Phycisphaeraceae bacterium]
MPLFDAVSLLTVLLIGLLSGVLGGMLGVGGSVVMIPAATLAFGYNQHLYQAAAMIMNVVVSLPAVLRHRKAGALTHAALKWMLPAALVTVILGVWLSNRPFFAGIGGGLWLGRILALFLVYVIALNVLRLVGSADLEPEPDARVTGPRSVGIGTIMGTIAGLLGIGGGAVAVPLQQVLMRLPLRACIANSAAIICISAGLGAIYKNATLARHAPLPTDAPDLARWQSALVDLVPGLADASFAATPIAWQWSLLLAALLAPTAWLGGRLGASLTHRLPIRQVRIAFIILMIVAAWRMAAIPGSPI